MTAVMFSSGPVIMLLAALWAWQAAPRLTVDALRPDVLSWSMRLAAVAVAASAQACIVLFVCRRVYRPGLFDRVLQLSAVLVVAVSLVAAAALALAGQ